MNYAKEIFKEHKSYALYIKIFTYIWLTEQITKSLNIISPLDVSKRRDGQETNPDRWTSNN